MTKIKTRPEEEKTIRKLLDEAIFLNRIEKELGEAACYDTPEI